MLSQLIQRQVPIGSKVTFSLKTGEKVTGILVELGREHITLETNSGYSTILVDMIGKWDVEKNESDEVQQADQVERDQTNLTPITNNSNKDTEIIATKLIEIQARYRAQTEVATIEIKPPDFSFPNDELKGKRSNDAMVIWNRIKDRYTYAAKINELSTKFGRIQPIFSELRTLAEWYPTSPSIKRHLAYFYWLTGDLTESMNLWQEAALKSSDVWDWYNLAVVSTRKEKGDLACFSLFRFFSNTSITLSEQAWQVYIRLVKEISAYSILADLLKFRGEKFSDDERNILLETILYLLQNAGHDQLAKDVVLRQLQGVPSLKLIEESLDYLVGKSDRNFQQLSTKMEEVIKEQTKVIVDNEPQGYIYKYNKERNFGFIKGVDGENYFFHRAAIAADEELLEKINKLSFGDEIAVNFDTAQGPKGPLAIGIRLYRTVEEMYTLADHYAEEGDFSKAIAQMKKVLELNPSYPNGQDLIEKWREYARIVGVPRGSSPYARAKRAQLLEKDLEKAEQLLRLAIKQGDNVESALKDLATLLNQQSKPQDAIKELQLNRAKFKDKQSVDNLLIALYQNAGEYTKAIELLERKLSEATTDSKRTQILFQIANNYLRNENYPQAERTFREVLKRQRDNRSAQRNIAFCLFKQNRFEEAQNLLQKILNESPDPQSETLLEAIQNAKAGQIPEAEEISLEATIFGLASEISKFAQFFLERCDYQGVPPDRAQSKNFKHTDIKKLEELATKLGTRRPRDRAAYYLSAAKIVSVLEDNEDPNLFYKYLCRSFASQGDTLVAEGRPLDAAREYYIEALSAYDGDHSQTRDEQDAVNALVRYLFSILGSSHIPLTPSIPSIDETLETVLSQHPERIKVFEYISYITHRSYYAAQRLLSRLYSKPSLQAMALDYLKNKGITIENQPRKLQDFIQLWHKITKRRRDEFHVILDEFRFFAKIELNVASTEDRIERIKQILDQLFVDLDRERMLLLQKILEATLDLCKQVTFEEQERLCIQIDHRCQELLEEIAANPTKLAVEEMYDLIKLLQNKIRIKLSELYENSTPKLELRLPVESYTPDHNLKIEAQVVVKNQLGCSPAESLELVVQKYEDTFSVPLDGSLRGGDQRILRIALQVDEDALSSQAFSLPVYARYRKRSGEVEQTAVSNFSIRLSSEEEFETIENPYATYAEGGIVRDPAMFFGRSELITNLAKTLMDSRFQSKCVVVYGQKRAGKSSILYHLKKKLECDEDLIILDLGNIGAILDEHSRYPFLYQFLFGILRRLEYSIEDKIESGYSKIDAPFPTDREFYEHPSPLDLFMDIFERFRRTANKHDDWRGKRFILLVDEFSYIYSYIMRGLIPDSFMKNWKALLERNYFSAVLVGQDVMPKFKQRFPNEFGIIQDERVTYLKKEDAERLIDEPIRIGGRQGNTRYRERAIERIIDLTAGSPFYIQILCNRLVEYMNRKHASLVTEADVEQVKDELIRGANALTLDKFDNLLNSGDTTDDAISDEDSLKVLTAIASNSRTGPASRYNIDCETQTPLDEILDDLVKRDVIDCERGYYSIKVGLFKEWLIAHS